MKKPVKKLVVDVSKRIARPQHVKLAFHISPAVKNRLVAQARVQGVTMAEVVRSLLDTHLQKSAR